MVIAALVLWLAHPLLDVVSEGGCPVAVEVERHLARLLPSPGDPGGRGGEKDGGPARHRIYLSHLDGGTLHIDLAQSDGRRLAERDLAGDGSCEDLAAAAAVVIAAWEARFDAGAAGELELPSRPVQPPAARPARPPGTAPEQPPPAAVVNPELPGPPRSFSLGIGLLGSFTGGQLAPGAKLEGSLAPAGRRLGLGLALSAATARTAPVGALPGAARWTRVALAAGPQYRWGGAGMMLDLHLEALAALLWVEGEGLSSTASDTGGQLGVGGGVRTRRAWGNAAPWVGVDILAWPGRDWLKIDGVAAKGELPRLEVQVAFGLSLGQFP